MSASSCGSAYTCVGSEEAVRNVHETDPEGIVDSDHLSDEGEIREGLAEDEGSRGDGREGGELAELAGDGV